MDSFYPFAFFLVFFAFIIFAYTRGEKTSHEDDDIDDYWSGD